MYSSSSRSRSGNYDDLTLPPIRDSTYASPRGPSRYVTTLEPPAHPTSSMGYSRNAPVLPPLNPERSKTSMGHHLSHGYAPASPTSSRHPDARMSGSYRPPHTSMADPGFHHYPQPIPNSHRSNSFGENSGSPPTARAFSCDICGATFSRAYDCKRHRDIHTRQGGHECPYCHKSLSRADALKRHMERGCAGMEEDDEDLAAHRKDRRNSTGGDTHKYYAPTASRR